MRGVVDQQHLLSMKFRFHVKDEVNTHNKHINGKTFNVSITHY